MGVCGSSVCVSVLCVCVSIVCLCVVLTLWPVRRLVNLADATAQPQLQPSQDAPPWPPAFFLLLPPLPPSYMLLSLPMLVPLSPPPHGILQFLWDFEIAFSTFAALANVAPTFHLSSPPRPGWLAAFNFSAVSPIVDAVVYPAFDCFTYPSMPHPSPPRIVGLRFLLRPATKAKKEEKNRSRKMTFVGFRNFHCTRN